MMRFICYPRHLLIHVSLAFFPLVMTEVCGWAAKGELELTVVASEGGETLPAQIQLLNEKSRRIIAPGLPTDGEWQLVEGRCVLSLTPGVYAFRLRRGLEYRERSGQFVLSSGAADNQQVDLPRFVDMAKEGWWSGDLEVFPRGPASQLSQRILASDLHLVSPIRWANSNPVPPLPMTTVGDLGLPATTRRFADGAAGMDRREAAVTILFGASQPFELPPQSALLPSTVQIIEQARKIVGDNANPLHAHFSSVAHADLPIAVACGVVDSVGLLASQITASGVVPSPQDQPFDGVLFPGPNGAGEWAHRVFYQLLESGHRIVPGAGSGSGMGPNPLGANRTYVYCDGEFSAQTWWQGLRAGRVVVTNGPLLRPRINGELPGHVFHGTKGQKLELELELELATQDKIQYLEIIKNGRPVQQVRLEEYKERRGKLPAVVMDASGWILVRVVADHPTAYRCATSGPFYVEFDGQKRVSRGAAKYFLDWVYDRARKVRAAQADANPETLTDYRRARDYWQSLVDAANID